MGRGVEGVVLRNRIRVEHADRAGSRAVRPGLPPVTVDAPKPQAARPTQPSRRAARSQTRDAPRRGSRPAAGGGTGRPWRRRARTRQRPGCRLSRQAERHRHQDRHADSDHAAVDLGRDQGSDRGSRAPRTSPRRCVIRRVTRSRCMAPRPFFDADVKLRGFDAPRYLDGLRLPVDTTNQFANPRIETYGLERIEVLQGPSVGPVRPVRSRRADQHGQQAADRDAAAEIVGTFGSFDQFQGAFDTRRSDRQERRISLSPRRSGARSTRQSARLRPREQGIHRAQPDLAADQRHVVHIPLALFEHPEQGMAAICAGRRGGAGAQSEWPHSL